MSRILSCFRRLRRLTEFNCDELVSCPIVRAMCEGRVPLERLTLWRINFPACLWELRTLRYFSFTCCSADALPVFVPYVKVNRRLEEIRIDLPNNTFKFVWNMLHHVPAQVSSIDFHVNLDELRSRFITYNLEAIVDIDRWVKASTVRVSVFIHIWWTKARRPADTALLERCQDCLYATSH